MDKTKLIQEIRDILDLNLYEAKVYLAILAHAPIELKELYKKSDIPQSRAYDITNSLKNKGLINSFNKNSHEFYRSLDPKNSINAYFTQLKWESDETLERARMKFDEKTNSLKKDFNESLINKKKKSLSLLPLLKDIYSRSIPSEDELVRIVKGNSNLVNFIAEQIKNSNKIIKNTSVPNYLPESLIWENLLEKLGKGLEYNHLAYSGLLFEWGIWRIKEDIKSGVEFRFLPKEKINEKFYIFDETSCFVRLRDPITNNFSDQGISFKEQNWTKSYSNKFNLLWEHADSFERLEESVSKRLKESLKNLNDDEINLIKRILERGKYATTDGLEINNLKQILKSLEVKKLIVPHDKAILGYILNIKYFLGEDHTFI